MHLLAVLLKITIKFRLHIDYCYELCLKLKKFTMYKRLLDISNNSHFLAIGRYHRTSLYLFGFGLSTDCKNAHCTKIWCRCHKRVTKVDHPWLRTINYVAVQ